MHKACRHRHSIQGANLPAEGGAAQDLVVVVLVGWLGGSENEAVGRR
jgi:predicted HD phosphohydrolase